MLYVQHGVLFKVFFVMVQKEILDLCLERYYDRMIEGIQNNMRIPSVKGKPEAGAPYGKFVNMALEDALLQAKELGLRVKNIDHKIGYAEIGKGDQMIAVLGHLDVVPAEGEWKHPPYEAVISEGILWGRGALDDKGPIIGALYALKAIQDSGIQLNKRIRVILGTDEESGSSCVKHYITSKEEMPSCGFTPDAQFPVIYSEKGAIQIVIEQKLTAKEDMLFEECNGGKAINAVMSNFSIAFFDEQTKTRYQKNFEGKNAHASEPWKGINAALKASKELLTLDDVPEAIKRMSCFIQESLMMFPRELEKGVQSFEEDLGKITINLGKMYKKKESVFYEFDIRYPYGINAADVIDQMGQLSGKYEMTIADKKNNPPLYISKDTEIVRKLMNLYCSEMGEEIAPIAIGGSTYAKSFPNMVAFGPIFPFQENKIHQPNESVDLKDLYRAITLIMYAMVVLAQ